MQVVKTRGLPPDMYRISYNIKGLRITSDGRIFELDEHLLEINLGLEYPRRGPKLRLLTTLFHPNFSKTEVCAQDTYAASEGLDDLIIRIGKMIAYQEYNTKSPLNGIAAKWAAENSHRLPIDRREIAPTTPVVYRTKKRHLPMNISKEIKISPNDKKQPKGFIVNEKREQCTQSRENKQFPYMMELKRMIYAQLLKEKKDDATVFQAKVECNGDAKKAEMKYYQLRYKQIVESGEINEFKEKILAAKRKKEK